jgi:hypothetical protein
MLSIQTQFLTVQTPVTARVCSLSIQPHNCKPAHRTWAVAQAELWRAFQFRSHGADSLAFAADVWATSRAVDLRRQANATDEEQPASVRVVEDGRGWREVRISCARSSLVFVAVYCPDKESGRHDGASSYTNGALFEVRIEVGPEDDANVARGLLAAYMNWDLDDVVLTARDSCYWPSLTINDGPVGRARELVGEIRIEYYGPAVEP